MNISTDTNLDSIAQSAAIHLRNGRTQEAESLYRKILERRPDNREALFIMAQLLKLQKTADEANTYEHRFLSLGPSKIDIHVRMGRFFHIQGNYSDALANYRKALALGANSLELHRNIGDSLLDDGNPAEALIHYQKALKFEPRSAAIFALMGEAYRSLNRFEEALSHARKAIAIEPGLVFSQETVAGALLTMGKYESGLLLNEKRLNVENVAKLDATGISQILERFSDKPRWRGEDLKGQTLLVWTEPGVGDNIMMMRYLPLLKQKGIGSLIVYCEQALVKIMLSMNNLVVSKQLALSNDSFDLHCSMSSLPYLFGTRMESIPASVPYLHLPSDTAKKWRVQLKKFAGLKVGIAWAGSKTMGKDRLRSIALERFAPLLAIQGVQFVSLQKDEAAQQLAAHDWHILDWMDACQDLIDTAALIDSLDLVVSVDTAIVHLAGALGKPVWLLNRFESEWCWMVEREDAPWYPSMRIYRQPATHDWDSVMNRAAFELGKLVSGRALEARSERQWEDNVRAANRSLGIGNGDKEKAVEPATKWNFSKLWRR